MDKELIAKQAAKNPDINYLLMELSKHDDNIEFYKLIPNITDYDASIETNEILIGRLLENAAAINPYLATFDKLETVEEYIKGILFSAIVAETILDNFSWKTLSGKLACDFSYDDGRLGYVKRFFSGYKIIVQAESQWSSPHNGDYKISLGCRNIADLDFELASEKLTEKYSLTIPMSIIIDIRRRAYADYVFSPEISMEISNYQMDPTKAFALGNVHDTKHFNIKFSDFSREKFIACINEVCFDYIWHFFDEVAAKSINSALWEFKKIKID